MHPKNICAPLLLNIFVEHFQIVIKAAALTQMLLTTAFAIHFRETNITSLPHMILGRIYLVLMRQTIQSYGRTRGKKFCLRPLNPAMMQKKVVQWQELLPWFKLKVADREEKSNHWCSTWIETIPRWVSRHTTTCSTTTTKATWTIIRGSITSTTMSSLHLTTEVGIGSTDWRERVQSCSLSEHWLAYS